MCLSINKKPCEEQDTPGSHVPEKKKSKPCGSPLQKNKNGKDKIKILVNTSNFAPLIANKTVKKVLYTVYKSKNILKLKFN